MSTRQADADTFRAAIVASATGRYAACVTVHPVDAYRRMRCYLTDDGAAGFAITSDGDIVSVFARPGSGMLPTLMADAIRQGGTHLDCFDTVLPSLYAACGFVETSRMPWSDEYAPNGWDPATYARFNNGRPDVVMMALPA